jgi:hypothetical protein
VPTNWAGTPDGLHLDFLNGFAKTLFLSRRRATKRPGPWGTGPFKLSRTDQTFGGNKVVESTLTPGPMVDDTATRLM